MNRSPLKRRTPLKRGGPLRRVAKRLKKQSEPVPAVIVSQIATRARYRCERCEMRDEFRDCVPHHKLRRSQGGSNDPENLAYLCAGPGGCHSHVHDNVAQAIADGWIVSAIERNRLV